MGGQREDSNSTQSEVRREKMKTTCDSFPDLPLFFHSVQGPPPSPASHGAAPAGWKIAPAARVPRPKQRTLGGEGQKKFE